MKSNKLWYAIICTPDKISLTKFYKTYSGLRRAICRQYENVSYYAIIKCMPADFGFNNEYNMILKSEDLLNNVTP